MNAATLLAALAGRGEGQRPRPTLPIWEAQIDRLAMTKVEIDGAPDLQPGQLVTLRKAFEYRADPWEGAPMMVLEVADPGRGLDGYFFTHRHEMGDISFRKDVALLTCEPNGVMGIRVWDRRMLTLWVAPEPSKMENPEPEPVAAA